VGQSTRDETHEGQALREEIREALGLASAFTCLAALAAEEGAFARAVRLLGAADAVCERTDAELEPLDAELYERTTTAARSGLGDEAFTRAREEGRNLGLDEAAEVALEAAEPAGGLG
jgi:hypothetical protein